MDNIITDAFRRIYGLPCWNVKPGHGSYLTLEFGQPHLHITEPRIPTRKVSSRVREHMAKRIVTLHGDWHLWLLCCDWKLTHNGKIVGDSQTQKRIMRAAQILDGQFLIDVSVEENHRQCLFKFDLGSVLETVPYDMNSEQWLLFEPFRYGLNLSGRWIIQPPSK